MQTKTIILISLFLLIRLFMNGQISDNVGDNTRFGQAAGLNNANSDTEILQISFFGRSAGLDNTGAANSFFGYSAGRLNSTGRDNSFFGHRTGFSNTKGSQNSFFGRLAGQFNTSDNNSFFGYAAGDSTSTGEENSFFGSEAGLSNRIGKKNSFFGYGAGKNNKASNNSYFGSNTGSSIVSGGDNSLFGSNAGSSLSAGLGNSFFGQGAGVATGAGDDNSFFGKSTGSRFTGGTKNSFFGRGAGGALEIGDSNICIGYHAGPLVDEASISNALFIDVETRNDPLIYGSFSSRLIRINGSFEAMGGVSNSSDLNRKEAIVPIDELGILEKVSELELSEWSYKDASDIRHLGPMAQDFYKQFGLGKNEKTIGTLDADGVALASIQALYRLWQDEKERNDQLEKKVDMLIKRMEDIDN